MLLLPYWSIFLIISPHFIGTHAATKWNIVLCSRDEHNFVRISLDKIKYVNLTGGNGQKCFNTEFELDDATKPSYLEFKLDVATRPSLMLLEKDKVLQDFLPLYDAAAPLMNQLATVLTENINYALVQNRNLQEMYYGYYKWNSYNQTKTGLEKMDRWTFEVTRSDINDDFKSSYRAAPHYYANFTFSKYSRTSNASFFLSLHWNELNWIAFFTEGEFGLEKKVKVQNMANNKIYSCMYTYGIEPPGPAHICVWRNDSTWNIEMTYQSKYVNDYETIIFTLRVTGGERNSSVIVSLEESAYVSAFTNFFDIPNENINEIEIEFNGTKKPFDMTKVVMTKMLTGEEYGCVDIHWTNSMKCSCKVKKGKKWLLKVISPEVHERTFSVELIQDTLSSFTNHLTWKNFGMYGDEFIKYFNLKTYEDKEITSINLHFKNESLKINEISMISNYTEYKFNRNEDSSTHNSSVAGFSRITKEKFNSNETILVLKIDT
ncbi:uncharacterized protein LOC115224696 [Octopus sinensis]|uniref:Uncharacterized protein LOC115224696 n=1 Tax=Octopus sinensis TaxID=2607531 RepID=A0A6P7TPR7_9MOLL|nr:uncharacterized protein LOC115224696 [Octopus sinensis]